MLSVHVNAIGCFPSLDFNVLGNAWSTNLRFGNRIVCSTIPASYFTLKVDGCDVMETRQDTCTTAFLSRICAVILSDNLVNFVHQKLLGGYGRACVYHL